MIVPIANEDCSTWRGIFCQVISLTCVMAPLWQEARTTPGAGPDVITTYRKASEPISLYNRWLSSRWKDALFVYIFSVLMSLKVIFSDRCVICLLICSFFLMCSIWMMFPAGMLCATCRPLTSMSNLTLNASDRKLFAGVVNWYKESAGRRGCGKNVCLSG